MYPTNNYNRTQRISPIVPSEWVGAYPTNGYDATQQLGTRRPNCWVQKHEKGHQNDVDIFI
ncbi:MAG: hypothetical protein ACFNS5_08805 [Prevotella melaninogenica]